MNQMMKWIVFWFATFCLLGCSNNDNDTAAVATANVRDSPALPNDLPQNRERSGKSEYRVDATICDRICQHGIALSCGPIQSCLEGCMGMLAMEACAGQMKSFLVCAASRPATSFECDEQTNAPALKENECATEQMAVGACMEQL